MSGDVISISERLNEQMAEMAESEAAPVTPLTGVYRNVDFEAYGSWDAASQSRLSRLVPPWTPAHCLAYMLTPQTRTPALVLGEALHTAILEPDRFGSEYLRAIEGDGRTKAIKDARDRQRADNPGAAIISAADYETTIAVRDSVWRHPAARALLERVTDRELSLCWQDDGSGELCKGRLDAIAPDIETIIDIKSTRNASRDAFAGSVRQYGYHRQGAMYLNGSSRFVGVGPRFANYVFIAFEKVPPFAVAVYRLSEASIIAGATELATTLALYAKCRRENHWPAYSDEIEDIDITAGAPALVGSIVETW